jgi:hypothetical protein
MGNEKAGPEARHAEDFRDRPKHNHIVQAAADHAPGMFSRGKGQVRFVDDEADLWVVCAQGDQGGVVEQRSGGVVGIAEKDGIDLGQGKAELFDEREKAVLGSGEEELRFNPMHPAAVDVVGIGGTDNQRSPRVQGRTGGVDKLGGAGTGKDSFRGDIQQAGNGANGCATVDFGEATDSLQAFAKVLDQPGHGAQRVDIAAHIGNGLDRAAQLLGQGRNIAAVSLNHDRPLRVFPHALVVIAVAPGVPVAAGW